MSCVDLFVPSSECRVACPWACLSFSPGARAQGARGRTLFVREVPLHLQRPHRRARALRCRARQTALPALVLHLPMHQQGVAAPPRRSDARAPERGRRLQRGRPAAVIGGGAFQSGVCRRR